MGYSVLQVETGKMVYEDLDNVDFLNDILTQVSSFCRDYPSMDSKILVDFNGDVIYEGPMAEWTNIEAPTE